MFNNVVVFFDSLIAKRGKSGYLSFDSLKFRSNIVDVKTAEIVHSVQGAGEYALSEREILGFGSTASYDSTLNGKVLDLAVREAVNNLVLDIQTNKWSAQ